jgi:hypothetical protein
MLDDLDKSIESAKAELSAMVRKMADLKGAINQLLAVKGLPPEYSDVEALAGLSLGPEPKKRDFIGMNVMDATKQYLRMTGRAATAAEILSGLEKGDCEFPAKWTHKLRLKNLAIQLGSTSEFVSFPTKEGKAYGLAERYPDKVKERERNQKTASDQLGAMNREESKTT